MILFRPVGLEELRLLYVAGMRAFPPRLPDQPIFYPVTNATYARQIARDWNTKAGTRAGFVTRFAIPDDYASRFERRVVGAREHEELWVPAEELAELNARVEGNVEVIDAFFGDDYRGVGAPGHDAREHFVAMARSADARHAVACDRAATFLDFFFWERGDFTADGITPAERDALLAALRTAWGDAPMGLGLGAPSP